jgi:hypothetical protein
MIYSFASSVGNPSLLFSPCKPFILPPITSHLSPDFAIADECVPVIKVPWIGSTLKLNGTSGPSCAYINILTKLERRTKVKFLKVVTIDIRK